MDRLFNMNPPNTAAATHARRGLAFFFTIVLFGTAIFAGLIMKLGGPVAQHPLLVLGLMWVPAIAMIIARTANHEGFSDVSFHLGFAAGRRRNYMVAWLFPLVVGSIAYGTAWTMELVPFAAPRAILDWAGEHNPPTLLFTFCLCAAMTLGTVGSAFFASGEELGWRGYMLTRLIDAGVPRPVLVSGILWALWHAPLVLNGQYAASSRPVFSATLFTIALCTQGYLYGHLRLATGSVWPAVLLHSTWNAVIPGLFDHFVPGHSASQPANLWIGEAGALVVLVGGVLALASVVQPIALRRRPDEASPRRASISTL